MAGILKEGKAVMEEDLDDTTMDACLIASAQRVEHYEMAAYGTVTSCCECRSRRANRYQAKNAS
jgi:ferritin-like metal-binding protein YciE